MKIPLLELSNHVSKLDPNIKFVTVCGKGGGSYADAAMVLMEYGYHADWPYAINCKYLNINTLQLVSFAKFILGFKIAFTIFDLQIIQFSFSSKPMA